jgi:hypothetical protein
MEPLELTTELDAVNAMLASIGESSVADIDSSFEDAAIARDLLRRISRQFQLKGWTFNTDEGATLAPNTDGEIVVPSSTLKMEPLGGEKYVLRGFKVYDRVNRTTIFTTSFTANLTTLLPWDELPEAARQFLYMRGARRFQDFMGNDNELRRIQAADEQSAWAAFLDYEAEQAQYNAFTANTTLQRMRQYRNSG